MARTPKGDAKAPAPSEPEDLDPAQAALYREVDEDLRSERLQAAWKRYGGYVIGTAVLVVALVAGFQGWSAWQASVRADEARRYHGAVGAGGAPLDRAALEALAAEGGTGYAALAELETARDLARDGDVAGAIAGYDALSSDGGQPAPVRQLATVLAALHAMDVEDPQSVRGRVSGLTGEDSPWRFMAQEIIGLSAARAGDTTQAREVFASLGDSSQAPPGVRRRAAEMLALLGGAPFGAGAPSASDAAPAGED